MKSVAYAVACRCRAQKEAAAIELGIAKCPGVRQGDVALPTSSLPPPPRACSHRRDSAEEHGHHQWFVACQRDQAAKCSNTRSGPSKPPLAPTFVDMALSNTTLNPPCTRKGARPALNVGMPGANQRTGQPRVLALQRTWSARSCSECAPGRKTLRTSGGQTQNECGAVEHRVGAPRRARQQCRAAGAGSSAWGGWARLKA